MSMVRLTACPNRAWLYKSMKLSTSSDGTLHMGPCVRKKPAIFSPGFLSMPWDDLKTSSVKHKISQAYIYATVQLYSHFLIRP